MQITLIDTNATLGQLSQWRTHMYRDYTDWFPIGEFPEFLRPALNRYLDGKTLSDYAGRSCMSREDFDYFWQGAWSQIPIRFALPSFDADIDYATIAYANISFIQAEKWKPKSGIMPWQDER